MMADQTRATDDVTMLKSISKKEREVEALIAQAREEGEAKIQDARRRASEMIEEARSRGQEEKRLVGEKALEAVQKEVHQKEQEYEDVLKSMSEKARAQLPRAVEKIIEAILPH
jgi:vacuolar-type H+-ATPase subunit H